MVLLNPFLYWAQSETHIFIKVDLRDVKSPSNITIDNRSLSFGAQGVGARGLGYYYFSLDLYSEINCQDCSYKVLDNKVDFTLTKQEKGWWIRLISQSQKPAWLKIDFERWKSQEDLTDNVRDVREDYRALHEQLQKTELGYRKEDLPKVYLVIYSLLMTVGYLYISIVLTIMFLRDGTNCMPKAYSAVGPALKLVHLLHYLEICNAVLGFTQGVLLPTLLRVNCRNAVLFVLISLEPRLQTKPIVFNLFALWAATELVRYPLTITKVYKKESALLNRMCSMFLILLYPIGFILESVIVFHSILYFEESGKLTLPLPNMLNFSFHFPTMLRIYLLIFSFPVMYTLVAQIYKSRQRNTVKSNRN